MPIGTADLPRDGDRFTVSVKLRDSAGALVPVDFIELTDWPGGVPAVAAFIQLRDAHAPVPATVPPQPRTDSDTAEPAA